MITPERMSPQFPRLLMEVAMKVCTFPKAVHVCRYLRRRFGRWEWVCEHCRSYPRR